MNETSTSTGVHQESLPASDLHTANRGHTGVEATAATGDTVDLLGTDTGADSAVSTGDTGARHTGPGVRPTADTSPQPETGIRPHTDTAGLAGQTAETGGFDTGRLGGDSAAGDTATVPPVGCDTDGGPLLTGSGSLPSFADIGVTGDEDLGRLGSAVAVGDFTGDGVADLAIGAAGASIMPNTQHPHGAIYLLSGVPTSGPILPVRDVAMAKLIGEETYETGCTLEVGDVSGDGVEDLVAGFCRGERPVRILLGPLSVNGQVSIADATDATLEPTGNSTGSRLALEVTPDMDGDGINELLLGSEVAYLTAYGSGKAWLHLGPIMGSRRLEWDADVSFHADSDLQGAQRLGSAVAAGDVDGDGATDVLLGARGAAVDGTKFAAGKVFGIYNLRGPGSVDVHDADFIGEGPEIGSGAGSAIGLGGDLDGDGYGCRSHGLACFCHPAMPPSDGLYRPSPCLWG